MYATVFTYYTTNIYVHLLCVMYVLSTLLVLSYLIIITRTPWGHIITFLSGDEEAGVKRAQRAKRRTQLSAGWVPRWSGESQHFPSRLAAALTSGLSRAPAAWLAFARSDWKGLAGRNRAQCLAPSLRILQASKSLLSYRREDESCVSAQPGEHWSSLREAQVGFAAL